MVLIDRLWSWLSCWIDVSCEGNQTNKLWILSNSECRHQVSGHVMVIWRIPRSCVTWQDTRGWDRYIRAGSDCWPYRTLPFVRNPHVHTPLPNGTSKSFICFSAVSSMSVLSVTDLLALSVPCWRTVERRLAIHGVNDAKESYVHKKLVNGKLSLLLGDVFSQEHALL